MVVLSERELRKKAEHNEGRLADLEEISLHQLEIEKIEAIEECCRHIRILLLQHNAIGRLENLSKLKELEYLNVALNNISVVEGLEGCESLNKLDLTCNFMDVEDLKLSMYNLKANVMLQDLYLNGNPCQDWTGCNDYVIGHLPQLKQLNGNPVFPKDRIRARRRLPALEAQLEKLAEASIAEKIAKKDEPFDEGANTKELRLQMNREMAAQKAEKEKNERERTGHAETKPREIPSVYNAKGDIRQCNEGKWDFTFDEETDSKCLIFELNVPKFLDTSMLDVDVHPEYVRIVVKNKLTQLRLPGEVNATNSKVQRSKTTGWLKITMPWVRQEGWWRDAQDKKKEKPVEIKPLEETDQKRIKAREAAAERLKGIVRIDEIVKPKSTEKKGEFLIKERPAERVEQDKELAQPVVVDDEEIPPLEHIGRRR